MKLYRQLACLLLLVYFGPVAASDCSVGELTSTSNKLGKLDIMYSEGCFGGFQDPNSLTSAVKLGLQQVSDNSVSETELAERRNLLLEILVQIEGSLANVMSAMDNIWQSYAAITLREIESAKTELRDFESTIPARYWFRGQNYGFFEQPATGKFLIQYDAEVDAACSTAEMSNKCRVVLESLVELTRHIELVRQVLENPVREKLRELHTELVKLDAEWDYYFDDAKSQFWWEFIANNAIYDPPGDSLARPPAGQLILLHPNAAIEYVDSGSNDDRAYNAIGIIEIIGYNRLRWDENEPYSEWPLGASLVTTYVPEARGDDFGYGFMMHVKNDYSFGATRRNTGDDTRTTWIFSVDLTRLFLSKSEEARRKFRSLQ